MSLGRIGLVKEIHTPNRYATSKTYTAPPTGMLGVMLWIRPGKLGGTEHTSATSARQFYQ